MNILPFTKTYGGRTVLRFPGAALEPGRVYAVIGANGSGKSTLARVAAGAIPADQNSRILDRPVKLGYMPQRSHPFRMSTRANILLPGGEPERADMLMEALGLTALARQRARGLSGGETARMALARVLMRPWELLILDEPTASMDMESAMLAEHLLTRYREETNCAILLITHDLQQARRLAEAALFLHSGQLWESGPAEAVLHSPKKAETRRFLTFYGGENSAARE